MTAGSTSFSLVATSIRSDTLPSGARYKEPKILQLNQKDGTFCDASEQAGPALRIPRVSRGVAAGDLFNTGNVDIVVEDLAGEPMIP